MMVATSGAGTACSSVAPVFDLRLLIAPLVSSLCLVYTALADFGSPI